MKLNYKVTPLDNGGAAVPGCGTIYIDEVAPTLTRLSEELGVPGDFNKYTLGSTGKKEYSGDLDVVMPDKWWDQGPVAFAEDLIVRYGEDAVKRIGNAVHLRYPIIGYDETKQESQPRTGYVQVDFNFGDYDWMKFFYHSPGDKSAYKGLHRNLAITSLCGTVRTIDSVELDSFGRFVEQFRWKFSPVGFMRVRRLSSQDEKTGKWKKTQVDAVIDGPYYDPELVVKTLLKDCTVDDLDSFESILSAINRCFDEEQKEVIYRRIAKNITEHPEAPKFFYPPEITKYLSVDDK